MNRTIKTFTKELEQIETSEASGGAIYTIPENVWNDKNWIAEPKLDGTRLKFHITSEGNRLDTRRISEKTNKFMERTNNFPHLRDLPLEWLEGTVLDGEGIAPVEKDTMGATQSMVGAGPEHSWEIQDRIGLLNYMAFDIIKYKGEDLRSLPFKQRRLTLNMAIKQIQNRMKEHLGTVQILEQIKDNKREFYEKRIAKGMEGIMLKHLDGIYGNIHGMLKVKKHIRLTMIITGFKPGAGKHKGKVGSVGIGFYGEEQLTYAGGLSDILRQDMQDNPKDYLGKVIEIECQEFTTTESLRHPRVVGTSEGRDSEDLQTEKLRIFRPDKAPEKCGRNQEVKIA